MFSCVFLRGRDVLWVWLVECPGNDTIWELLNECPGNDTIWELLNLYVLFYVYKTCTDFLTSDFPGSYMHQKRLRRWIPWEEKAEWMTCESGWQLKGILNCIDDPKKFMFN